jgi:two-component system sensor kinase FixL
MQPLDVRELVEDMLHLTGPDALRRRVSIQFEADETLPPAWGDRMHLQQVILNLILNAMDAAENQPDSRRVIRIAARHRGKEIQISVVDRGGGIAEEKMHHIFESFFTTKEEGMGLGLAIARSIVDAHRGRIWAENNADGGATVHFTIQTANAREL